LRWWFSLQEIVLLLQDELVTSQIEQVCGEEQRESAENRRSEFRRERYWHIEQGGRHLPYLAGK